MSWDDIRERAERPFDMAFEGEVEIDLPSDFLQSSGGRRLALELIEREASEFCLQIARAISHARYALSSRVDVTHPDAQAIPWLLAGKGREERVAITHPVHALLGQFDLAAPLDGQHIKGTVDLASLLVSANRQYATQPILVTVDLVELRGGSLWAKFKGKITATAPFVTLLLAVYANPYGQQVHDEWKVQRSVVEMVEGQKCTTTANWNIDLTSLRALAEQDLNYAEAGISDASRTLRVCNVQLMLLRVQGTPTLIDGMPGQQTRQALRYYAEKHGLPADISNVQLRGQLIVDFRAALHP